MWTSNLQVFLFSIDAKCKLPRAWRGRWYQGGLGELTIRPNSITKKGNCVAQRRDYFLMQNTYVGTSLRVTTNVIIDIYLCVHVRVFVQVGVYVRTFLT